MKKQKLYNKVLVDVPADTHQHLIKLATNVQGISKTYLSLRKLVLLCVLYSLSNTKAFVAWILKTEQKPKIR